jgi:thymidylate synthase (FAD)
MTVDLSNSIAVLDGGFVRLVDSWGDDGSIVQAARISYGEGTKTPSDDRTLIRYLMRHRHTTPFEMCELKLHVRVPMDTWRQWIRHRTASVNEYSTRYSEAIDQTAKTGSGEWRAQSTTNKQGSASFLSGEIGEILTREEHDLHVHAREVYERRLELGVAREQARKDLPLSTYTEAYWKCDLHNLLHFLALRLDPHAQSEIRAYAEAIATIVEAWVPLTWGAFLDYRLNAVTFSGPELRMLNGVIEWDQLAECVSRIQPSPAGLSSRELDELRGKLMKASCAYAA